MCRVLLSTQRYLKNPSESLKTTGNPRTHLVKGQDRAQRSQRLKIISYASGICTHAQSVRINAKTTAKTAEDVSITSNKQKQKNSPIGTNIWSKGETDGWGNHVNASTVCTCTGMKKEPPENG